MFVVVVVEDVALVQWCRGGASRAYIVHVVHCYSVLVVTTHYYLTYQVRILTKLAWRQGSIHQAHYPGLPG